MYMIRRHRMKYLATHVMPYDEIRFLKHFEDVFERFYQQ